MRHAAKRDANESQLVEVARKLGALIIQSPPLDFLVFHSGRWVPTEVKNPDGRNRLTDWQVKFLGYCKERDAPVYVWRTEADVLDSLNAKVTA